MENLSMLTRADCLAIIHRAKLAAKHLQVLLEKGHPLDHDLIAQDLKVGVDVEGIFEEDGWHKIITLADVRSLEMLIEARYPGGPPSHFLNQKLAQCVVLGRVDLMEPLLRMGADPEALCFSTWVEYQGMGVESIPQKFSKSALMLSVIYGQNAAFDRLVKAGVNVRQRGVINQKERPTPRSMALLHCAKTPHILNRLIHEFEWDVNVGNKKGMAPLQSLLERPLGHFKNEHERLGCLDLLLKAGASPIKSNGKTKKSPGFNALQHVLDMDDGSVGRLLISHGVCWPQDDLPPPTVLAAVQLTEWGDKILWKEKGSQWMDEIWLTEYSSTLSNSDSERVARVGEWMDINAPLPTSKLSPLVKSLMLNDEPAFKMLKKAGADVEEMLPIKNKDGEFQTVKQLMHPQRLGGASYHLGNRWRQAIEVQEVQAWLLQRSLAYKISSPGSTMEGGVSRSRPRL